MNRRRPASSARRVPSAVERITSELRERSLASKEGASLGSEEELSSEFGVSKPTLRQAARLLQYEGVLEVKRGVRGGYFSCRPSLEVISRLAATYLRSSAVSIDAIDSVLDALNPLIVTSVMKSGRTPLFAEFTQGAKDTKELTSEDMIESEGRFSRLMMKLTGNFPIELIHAIFYQVGFTIPRRDGPHAGRAEVVKVRMALAKAFVAQDAEAAIALSNRYRRLHTHGIKEDLRAGAQKRRKRPR